MTESMFRLRIRQQLASFGEVLSIRREETIEVIRDMIDMIYQNDELFFRQVVLMDPSYTDLVGLISINDIRFDCIFCTLEMDVTRSGLVECDEYETTMTVDIPLEAVVEFCDLMEI